MALTKTPICDFGKKAEDFRLQSINNNSVSLEDVKGKNGTLIMFICNHCPYVKAIIKDLVEDCKNLKIQGINSVAKKLNISVDNGKGYRVLANISEHGGQEVPHLHFHLFGGEKVGKMVE